MSTLAMLDGDSRAMRARLLTKDPHLSIYGGSTCPKCSTTGRATIQYQEHLELHRVACATCGYVEWHPTADAPTSQLCACTVKHDGGPCQGAAV